MKKSLAGILMIMLVFLGVSREVQADVIWEPENSFYKLHAKKCVYHNRNYIANGPDGSVTVYKSPEVNLKLTELENGTRVNVYWLYEADNGVLWGLYDGWEANITGWMPMDYLELEYDHICFVEEFGDQIQNKTVELAQEYVGQEILVWSYPGSENSSVFVPQETMEFGEMFVDEEGNTWGHTGYYQGWRNMWICIDNPQASFSELYSDNVPEREVSQEDKTPSNEEIVPEKGIFKTVAIVAVFVVLLSLVTLKILQKMKKKSVLTKDDSYEEI